MLKTKDIIFSSIGLIGWIFLILKIFSILTWSWIIILIPFVLIGIIQVIISDTLLGLMIVARIKRPCTTF